MAETDAALSDGLKRAKSGTADSPHHYALILKGGTDGKLIVDRKKVAPKAVAEAKKAIGSSAAVTGVVFYDRTTGEYVFASKGVPSPAHAKLIRTLAQRDGKVKIEARVSTLAAAGAAEPEPDEPETPEPPKEPEKPAVPPPPPKAREGEPAFDSKELIDKFARRANLTQKKMVAYLQASGPKAAEVKDLMREAVTVGMKGLYDQGYKHLNQLEGIIRDNPAPPKPPGRPPAAKLPPGSRQVIEQLRALKAEAEKLPASNPSRAKHLADWKAALDVMYTGDLDGAKALVGPLDRRIAASSRAATVSPQKRVKFNTALVGWNRAVGVARIQADKFTSAVTADAAAPDEAKAAAADLPEKLEFGDGLSDAIEQAAGDAKQQQAGVTAAARAVAGYRAALNDGVYTLTDGGPYGDFKIKRLLTRALDDVARALKS